MRIALILICLSLVTIAFAEPTVPQRSGPYLGVQPGMRDVAPNTKSRGATKQDNALTWVGFDMTRIGRDWMGADSSSIALERVGSE